MGAPVPTDLIMCTQAELDREIAAANPFVRQVLRDGLILYPRPCSSADTSLPP